MLQAIPDYRIHNDSEVKLTVMGNITEKMYLSRRNKEARIKKIDANTFEILSTGEKKQYKHIDNRSECKGSIKQSMRRLRNMLNANIIDTKKCRWVTITYAENMTDTKKLYSDFDKFNKRFKYYCSKQDYGNYEYIVAMEPQGRGAWHAHIVFIFERIAPYIENDILREIWGNGFVTIKKLDDVDNVGAYLTAYLGDMELNDAVEQNMSVIGQNLKEVSYMDENGAQKTKYFIKGARLHMYPTGFNLYRHSKGVKKPIEEYMTEKEAKKKVSAVTLTYSSTKQFISDTDVFECIIDKKYYNNKRDKNQDEIEKEYISDDIDYIKPTFNDEVRYAKFIQTNSFLPNYDKETGEIFSTPFDK